MSQGIAMSWFICFAILSFAAIATIVAIKTE